jgi:hypothetical protein
VLLPEFSTGHCLFSRLREAVTCRNARLGSSEKNCWPFRDYKFLMTAVRFNGSDIVSSAEVVIV